MTCNLQAIVLNTFIIRIWFYRFRVCATWLDLYQSVKTSVWRCCLDFVYASILDHLPTFWVTIVEVETIPSMHLYTEMSAHRTRKGLHNHRNEWLFLFFYHKAIPNSKIRIGVIAWTCIYANFTKSCYACTNITSNNAHIYELVGKPTDVLTLSKKLKKHFSLV